MKKQRFLGRRSPTSKIIHFPSVKCNELKYCESRLEYDRLLQLEFDKNVTYYEAQPDPIYYTNHNGRNVRYTPDLRVVASDGAFFFEEIKPYEKSIVPNTLRKHSLIASIYESDSISFKIVTEKDIYVGKRNENHRKLYRYLSEPISQPVKSALEDDLAEFCGPLCQLIEILSQRGYEAQVVMQLLAHSLLRFNIAEELTLNTEVAWHE